jgi:hypothetical protein
MQQSECGAIAKQRALAAADAKQLHKKVGIKKINIKIKENSNVDNGRNLRSVARTCLCGNSRGV